MADERVQLRKGREGSRWWNERPSSEDVAEWFKGVPLHEGMDHERYIGGIVLIEQKIKTKEIDGYRDNGQPIIRDGVEQMTYTPYPKVETRVQYFHDLMMRNQEWMGVIEPVGGDKDMPPGFTVRLVPHADGRQQTRFVCCTIRVRVYVRSDVKEKWVQVQGGSYRDERLVRSGNTVIDAPPATKMVPILGYNGKADPFSMMKAETGATGRALGMAGMLVVPGAGVATADDLNEAEMMEGRAAPPEQAGAEAAQLPAAEPQQPVDEDAALRAQATTDITKLREDFPEVFADFQTWAKEHGIESLTDAAGPALKGLAKKARKDLERAQEG